MHALRTHTRLLIDILSMKLFVRIVGQNGELLDSHLFFFDRYSELADHHRLKGRTEKADRLAALAEAHYHAAPGDDEPPEAGAIAMPVPQSPRMTSAVSTTRVKGPSIQRSGLEGALPISH